MIRDENEFLVVVVDGSVLTSGQVYFNFIASLRNSRVADALFTA